MHTSLERLCLLPWLPDDDPDLLTPEERRIWRRTEERTGFHRMLEPVPLQTPFATLRLPALDGEPATIPPPPTFRSPTPGSLPQERPPDVQKAVTRWREAVERLSPAPSLALWPRYNRLYTLAQTHLRCLAADAKQADTPLLERLQLASAVAACLWKWREAGRDDGPLALLSVRLSGVRRHLFDIADTGSSDLAHRLQGRSFRLTQTGMLFVWSLLDRLGLPPGNLLLLSGGTFLLLFAPTDTARGILEEAQREADRYSLEHLQGEVRLHTGWTEIPPDALYGGRFGSAWQEAGRKTAGSERRELAAVLQGADGWNEAAFLQPDPFTAGAPCRACGKPGQEREGMCRFCLHDARMGRHLTRAQWLVYERNETETKNSVCAFGWRARVSGGKPPEQAEWIVRLIAAEYPSDSPAPCRPLARRVPQENGAILPAREIARRTPGHPGLACLHADVDRLGERFAFGFQQEGDESRDSAARLLHLSRALEEFFGGWPERAAQQEEAPADVCIVYAGGGDLTAIGPHCAMVKMAWLLNRAFRRFLGYTEGPTEKTDALTLSAGIAFAPDRLPVPAVVRMAAEALEKAKKYGRNAIHLSGQTLPWRAFDRICRLLYDEVIGQELLDEKRTPSAFLYRLLQYAEMWERFRNGERDLIRCQPMLAYEVGRSLDPRKTPALHRWAGRLANIGLNDGGAWQREMSVLGTLARLAMLQRRGEERNE